MERINEEKTTPTSEYGECERCNSPLEPEYFLEEEYKFEHGSISKTGRVRKAVNVLVCSHCRKEYCVDDTLDGPWYRP